MAWNYIGLREISSTKLCVCVQHHAQTTFRLLLILRNDKIETIWIPDDCADFKLRFCMFLHTRLSELCGAMSTELLLTNYFCSSTMNMDVQIFVKACTHCLSTIGVGRCHVPFDLLYNEVLLLTFFSLTTSIWERAPVKISTDLWFAMIYPIENWVSPFWDTAAERAGRTTVQWKAGFGVRKNICLPVLLSFIMWWYDWFQKG